MNKIEQALLNADDLAISEEVDCSDVLGYINKLKVECADKERYTIELYNRARDAERKLREVRKETAKEIFQDLYNQANTTVWEAIEWTTDDIKQYANKYGVEVDE